MISYSDDYINFEHHPYTVQIPFTLLSQEKHVVIKGAIDALPVSQTELVTLLEARIQSLEHELLQAKLTPARTFKEDIIMTFIQKVAGDDLLRYPDLTMDKIFVAVDVFMKKL